MIENMFELKEKFEEIKKMGLVKSMRKGTTGIGYTFESLLEKKEDQSIGPDYKDIEIKCKLGYSKSDIGLFTCEPIRKNWVASTYIFQKYSYHLYGNENLYRVFTRKIFSNIDYELYDYGFKLFVDYEDKKLIIKSYNKGVFLENVCYWEFDELQKRLEEKLQNLALVIGYPYVKNSETYYKYFFIKFYRLYGFNRFLQLIRDGDIYVSIYLREGLNKHGDYKIVNNGISFKLKLNSINKLFYQLKI